MFRKDHFFRQRPLFRQRQLNYNGVEGGWWRDSEPRYQTLFVLAGLSFCLTLIFSLTLFDLSKIECFINNFSNSTSLTASSHSTFLALFSPSSYTAQISWILWSNNWCFIYCHNPNSTLTQHKRGGWHENDFRPPPPPPTTTTNSMSSISQLFLTRF